MRKYVFVGLGAFCGAVLRYLSKGLILFPGYEGALPLGTLAINVLGAFLLAFVSSGGFSRREPDPDVRLGLTAGFLGAFTTFSALCRETASLGLSGDLLTAAAYPLLSAALGLAGAYLGSAAAGAAAVPAPALSEEEEAE